MLLEDRQDQARTSILVDSSVSVSGSKDILQHDTHIVSIFNQQYFSIMWQHKTHLES
jgi:hypothetical protein